jgi:hypothetical protein
VNRPGYLSATPVADPDAVSSLVVVWLDDDQLAAPDETEPDYHRVGLPPDSYVVALPFGRARVRPVLLPEPARLPRGRPGNSVAAEEPAEPISDLLEGSPALRGAVRNHSAGVAQGHHGVGGRDMVRALLLREERLVMRQDEFADLPRAYT